MAAFSPELSAVWQNMEKIKALATRNIQAMRDETVFLSPINRPYAGTGIVVCFWSCPLPVIENMTTVMTRFFVFTFETRIRCKRVTNNEKEKNNSYLYFILNAGTS